MRRSTATPGLALVLAVGLLAPACRNAEEAPAPAPEAAALSQRAQQLFGTLPKQAASPKNPISKAKLQLGRMLFHETRLSKSQQISCNSCHMLSRYGVDGEPTSPGHGGKRGKRNSPTVYNAALHVAQFWDGRAADVEEQAKGPVLNPDEMGMLDAAYVLRVLRSIPDYERVFRAAFPHDEEAITFDHVAQAIGAFERKLMTPSRFDDFLRGDLDALDEQERAGLDTFITAGCPACHNGAAVGGGMFQKLGLVKPYQTADLGRFEVTGAEADRYVFKVPSLRNVEKTGPYFHDGSVATLPEAVRLMGRHQLGRELDDAQVQQIVAFLGSLTGSLPVEYIKPPRKLRAGPETPAPDET